jgi:hypothetical protein
MRRALKRVPVSPTPTWLQRLAQVRIQNQTAKQIKHRSSFPNAEKQSWVDLSIIKTARTENPRSTGPSITQ